MEVLSNPAAEKAVLSAIYNGGIDIYYEVFDIIRESTFIEANNKIMYMCLKHCYEVIKVQKCDIASFQSAAHELSLESLVNRTECSRHIRQIIDFQSSPDNIKKFAQKIRKLEIARTLHAKLEQAQELLLDIKGSESVTEILSIAEDKVFDFSSILDERDEDPQPLVEGLMDLLHELKDNPVSQPGISTGFKYWDACIGGGLRGGTINVIGARSKGFKSGLALNMSKNIAMLGLPVLYLDTEMTKIDQQMRFTACQAKTPIRDIETGQFGKDDSIAANVLQAAEDLATKGASLDYKTIAGFSFEEQIATMRRWLFKRVGVNTDRKANPCVIIYDYLKMMDSEGLKDLAEYQYMGFMMTKLHNFAVMYDVPIISFVQLNRDGIDKESVASVSQSDRIIWLCSNFSILKPKSDEEIAHDGNEYGNFKLAPLVCRHGPGLPPGEYISCNARRNCAFIEEMGLSEEIRRTKKNGQPQSN